MVDFEELADELKIRAGRLHHTNTCATSIAPAEEPHACDCAEDFVRLRYPSALLHEWRGPWGLDRKTFTIYPDDRIFRAIGDQCSTFDEAWESAAKRISKRLTKQVQP
jgi:hypothetical protein